MKKIFSMALIGLCMHSFAQEAWTSARPDGHAPIGVMGDHTHNKGELMFSYRFMTMTMEGMRDGTESLSSDDVTGTMMEPGDYMVSPTEMPMKMHMIAAMYAISDKFTLMAMTNYVQTEMNHVTRMDATFTTESAGIGDSWISGLYKFHDAGYQRAHFNLGVKIPTGSITKRDITPASAPNKTQLPYPMQTGTGTWDLKPGITFLSQHGKVSLGSQTNVQLPLSENENGYKLGTKTSLTAWGAFKFSNSFSFSLRGNATFQGKIDGSDSAFDMALANGMVPTVDPANFGGTLIFGGAGLNFYVPHGALKNVRIGIEYEIPFYQDINGPQMETKSNLTLGIQYSL